MIMKTLKIASINVNGFNHKATEISRFIARYHLHATFLQETHQIHNQLISHLLQKNNLHVIPNTFLSETPNSYHKHGTAIVVNRNILNIALDHIQSEVIVANRIQSVTFPILNSLYTIINVYFPSGHDSKVIKDRVHCINELFLYLKNLNLRNRKIHIVGDFNFTLNNIDRAGKFCFNSNDKLLFRQLLCCFDLIDIYRTVFPQKVVYTFSRTHPTSRLDRIYSPNSDRSNIVEIKHLPVSFSDHSLAPSMVIKTTSKIPTLHSYWMFRTKARYCGYHS